MSKLGDYLRTEREKKGLTIHEIGLSLKISSKILKAIEEGNQKDLPAKTFLRGFIKSYVQFLKIDLKVALDLFQEEYGSPKPDASSKQPIQAATSATNNTDHASNNIQIEKLAKKNDDIALANQGSQKHYTLLVAGILLVLIAFVAKLMDKYQKESNTTSQNELVGSLSTTSTTLQHIAATVSADNSANNISDHPLHANLTAGSSSVPMTSTSTTTTLAPTTTTMKPMATATTVTTTSTTTTKPHVTATTLTTTTSSTTTSSTTTSTISAKAPVTEVIVEALNQVRVRFSLNGGQKWEILELSADQVHTFRARGNVELEISDGGAVNVIVNGRERGVPGTIGKPIKLTYPK